MNHNKNNGNKKTFQKPVTKTFTVIVSGVDANGNEYDTDRVYDILSQLQEGQTFRLLNVPVNIDKSLLKNIIDFKNTNGFFTVGRLMDYNPNEGIIGVRFSSKNAQYADEIVNKFVVAPRIIISNGKPVAITSFDLVDAMIGM